MPRPSGERSGPGDEATGRCMCGLVFQGEVTFKGAQVVWYAVDAADWQASQTAANQ